MNGWDYHLSSDYLRIFHTHKEEGNTEYVTEYKFHLETDIYSIENDEFICRWCRKKIPLKQMIQVKQIIKKLDL